MADAQNAEPVVANGQQAAKPQKAEQQLSKGFIYTLNLLAALTQGVSTTNFSPDSLKMLYISIYKIDFDTAGVEIKKLLAYLSMSILVGSIVATFTLELLRSKIKYKWAAIMGAIGCTVFNVLLCIPIHPYYTLAMRLISGYFQTTYTMSTISIVGQLQDDKQKVGGGAFYQIFACNGMFLAYSVLGAIMATYVQTKFNMFYLSFIATFIFSVAGAICSLKVPNNIKSQHENEPGEIAEEKIRFADIFQRKYRKLTLLSIFLGLLQQFTGVNAVLIYATSMFESTFSGSYYSAVYGSLIITAFNIAAAVAAFFLLKIVPRRVMLFSSTFLCIVGTVMLIVNYCLESEIPALLLVASVIFIVGFELGPGPIFFAYAMEVFAGDARGVFNTLLQMFNFGPNLLIVGTFPPLQNTKKYVPFVIYLVGMLVCVGVLYYAAPETKGRTKRQIDIQLGIIAPDEITPVVQTETVLHE